MFNLKIWWAYEQLVICDAEFEGKKNFFWDSFMLLTDLLKELSFGKIFWKV